MNGFRRRLFRWRRLRCVTMFAFFFGFILFFVLWKSEKKTLILAGINYTHHPVMDKQIEEDVHKVSHIFQEVINTTDGYLYHISKQRTVLCNGSFVGYDKLFARLSYVVINPTLGHGRIGGENISSVLNQNEKDEYFKLDKGYFKILCKNQSKYSFIPKSHLNDWINALELSINVTAPANNTVAELTLAVMRYEYVNVYHTMTDFYNAFIVQKYFNIDPSKINILLIDGHPSGGLDKTWETLFGNSIRAGSIKQPVLYKNLVWGIMGYNSPLNQHDLSSLPLVEEFRHFFLSRHGIQFIDSLNCNKLNILFIWRRDYVAHSRNPSGEVSRKIRNEDELLKAVKDLLPASDVQGIQMDSLPITGQLQVISTVDILIGMHGAGLTHTLFLPKHAGLIELFPTYFSSYNKHFRTIAGWRELHYSTWKNDDQSKELPDHYTIVNGSAVVNMVHQMHQKLCPTTADKL